jgi:hypothetical protein
VLGLELECGLGSGIVRVRFGVRVTARKVEIEHSTQAQDVFLWGLFFRHVCLWVGVGKG